MSGNPFSNRLQKRARHLRKWAKRWPTNAYRLYDRDIPEYRWSVDIYGDHVFLQNCVDVGDLGERFAKLKCALFELGFSFDAV